MKALITGINGQDGSFLTEYLLSLGYEVHGLVRRTATNKSNLDHLVSDPDIFGQRLFFHYGDLADTTSVRKIVETVYPTEIYNLAAISNVPDCFHSPQLAVAINGNGFINILEAVKGFDKDIRIYQASTSEIFGKTYSPQDENTPVNPQSPYAWGKYVAHKAAETYREAYGMYVVSGILGNHESERRGFEFVTRKITDAVAKIALNYQDSLPLGNLSPKRDWGYAKEYMEWVYKSMQQDTSDTYVLGTGENHSVQEFVEAAFEYVGLNYLNYVTEDPQFFRPADVHDLVLDSTKAREAFGFAPTVKFKDLVKIMMNHDLERVTSWKKLSVL